MEGAIGHDDEPCDFRWQGRDRVRQELFVEANRRRRLASLPALEEPDKDRDNWRQAGSVREAMHRPPVLRHGDEPRSAAVVALVGLPQPDLEGQEGFVGSQRGLQIVEAGKRRRRTPRIVERQRNLSLGFLFSTLQPLELSETGAPSLIVQRRIHEHALDRGDGLEQLPPLPDGGVLRIPYRSRPVERVEQRPRPHALGHEEGQREIIVLAFLEQAPRQPVVVERPTGKERGAAVGIVLQRPERFHAVDGGQRVANGRGARLGVPAVPHVPAGAFGLRSGSCWRALSLQEPATPPLWLSARRSDA